MGNTVLVFSKNLYYGRMAENDNVHDEFTRDNLALVDNERIEVPRTVKEEEEDEKTSIPADGLKLTRRHLKQPHLWQKLFPIRIRMSPRSSLNRTMYVDPLIPDVIDMDLSCQEKVGVDFDEEPFPYVRDDFPEVGDDEMVFPPGYDDNDMTLTEMWCDNDTPQDAEQQEEANDKALFEGEILVQEGIVVFVDRKLPSRHLLGMPIQDAIAKKAYPESWTPSKRAAAEKYLKKII